MALIAAVAVAMTAWFAAAALGGAGIGSLRVPAAVLAVVFLPGVARAARNAGRLIPGGRDALFFTVLTGGGIGGLYLAGWTNDAHVGDVARLLPLAVVAMSVLWPQPNVLRYSVLLAVGSLVGVAVTPVAAPWAVVAALAAAAMGMVATSRLVAAAEQGPGALAGPIGPTAVARSGPGSGRAGPGRRLAAESGTVLALVGILAAIATALVPPPPGEGGGPGGDRQRDMADAAPAVGFDDRLDVGAGRGKRTDKVLFRVAADGPDLWRAVTYDRWDGAAWARSPDRPFAFPEADEEPDGPPVATDARFRNRTSFVPPGIGDPGAAEGRFSQRVTIEARAASILIAAARPVRVTVPYGSAEVGDDASLRPPFTLIRGQSYTVWSARSGAGAGELLALGDTTTAVPADVAGRYLQLPGVPVGLQAVAAEVTATAATTYERVTALAAWLDANVAATVSARPVPPGTDALEHLLAERAGPPERISAAFAVMLRTQGIPARLAVGFLPGERAGLSGDFQVRGRDTHAWVEVWFPTAGWQRFDPTGAAPPPGARDDSVWARLKRLLLSLWPLLLVAAAAAGGWLVWQGVRRHRRRAALPWVSRYFARLERAGRARGRPKHPEETPREYAAGLAASVLPDPRIAELGELVSAAAYSARGPGPEERARAEQVLRQAARAAPVRRFRHRARPRPADGPTIAEP